MVRMADDSRRTHPMKNLPNLPEEAADLCATLGAPLALENHLRLVHAAAVMLVEGLAGRFPGMELDAGEVLLGAAIHDLGKVAHPEELFQPGTLHEESGPALLISLGLEPRSARFARTHGNWRDKSNSLEDLLVVLADMTWKGERNGELEDLVCKKISQSHHLDAWKAWSDLDAILTGIAERISTVA